MILFWSSHHSEWVHSFRQFSIHLFLSPHLFSCLSIPVSHSFSPLWKPLSPLALLLSSPSVRLLQAALLPLCLPHVLSLEDMHLGNCCTLLCVLINILAASGRKWVFLWANLWWSICLEQREGKMMEKEGQARLFSFFYVSSCKDFQYKLNVSKDLPVQICNVQEWVKACWSLQLRFRIMGKILNKNFNQNLAVLVYFFVVQSQFIRLHQADL